MVPNSPGPITYSPAITLVPTYECFNRCQYCNFRTDPGQDTGFPWRLPVSSYSRPALTGRSKR
jgi:2-iminoacetate synthase ThiH